MAGWSAVSGTHDFVVPDETRARALAEDLAAFGFAKVLARLRHPATWIVSAVDEGPYPADTVGRRTIDAVGRRAAELARRHGGYPQGGSRCDPSMLEFVATGSIEYTNPGRRPPIPVVVMTPQPPAAALAKTPDVVEASAIDLTGLDDLDWASLGHAHGSAEDVPTLLQLLARNDEQWDEALDELFGDDLLHQGTCYSATAQAIPFVAAMVASGRLPVSRRLDLYLWLLYASSRSVETLVDDAGRAVVQNRPPEGASWTEDVHHAIGNALPALLARWAHEPPAGRYLLACLAAHHPRHGRAITDQVSAVAAEYEGTQPGAYLRLAEALLRGDEPQALTIAGEIVSWADDLDPGWLDAPGVSPALKATQVLGAGAPRAVS